MYGEPLLVPFTAELERADRSMRRQIARDVPARGRAAFISSSTRTYVLKLKAEAHRSVRKILRGTSPDEELDVALPIQPAAVIAYEWPELTSPICNLWLEGIAGDERRGALLNIWAKLWAVYLGVIPAGAFVDEILEVRVDRLMCRMSSAILSAIAEAPELDVVPSSLHDPPAGYTNGISVKTREAHGNLQISIFEPVEDPAAVLIADIDIDESRGLEHLFDVIEHHATGSKTNQIDVQQILIAAGIDPGWRPLI